MLPHVYVSSVIICKVYVSVAFVLYKTEIKIQYEWSRLCKMVIRALEFRHAFNRILIIFVIFG